MKEIIDNNEIEEILIILEEMTDEIEATKLLKEFNDATRDHGVLIMNQEKGLNHDDWKAQCDSAKRRVDDVVSKIRSFQK